MKTKYGYIDALRGLAILMVIVVHTGAQYNKGCFPTIVHTIISNGSRGVQLFFVASAFTLFLSGNNRQRELNKTTNFFLRRLFRIGPIYYLGIIYYLWQNGNGPNYWLGDATGISGNNILSNILFIHGINPYWINSLVPGGWSITVEMMFYCLVPFLIQKITSLMGAVNFLSSTILFNLVLTILLSQINPIGSDELWINYLSLYLPNQLPVFACGIIAFFIVIKKDFVIEIKQLATLGLLLIINQLLHIPNTLIILFGFTFSLLLIFLSKKSSSIIVNPFFSYLGKISYSAYITHFAVLYWLKYFSVNNHLPTGTFFYNIVNYFLYIALVVLITVLCSNLCYKLIEEPMIRIGKKLIEKMNCKEEVIFMSKESIR